MIRRLDTAMRSDLAAAPVDRGLALFEAAMMTRCAHLPGDISARGRGATRGDRCFDGVGREPGVLVELGSLAAAQRYRMSLAGLTRDVEVRERTQGLRHQYAVYQLVVPPRDEPKVVNRLKRAWDAGATLLTNSGRLTECMRRRTAARAVWRAALLVAGPGRGHDCVRVRLSDGSAAEALAAASSTLDIPARVLRRPGAHIVAVEGEDALYRLLAEAGSGLSQLAVTPALTRAG